MLAELRLGDRPRCRCDRAPKKGSVVKFVRSSFPSSNPRALCASLMLLGVPITDTKSTSFSNLYSTVSFNSIIIIIDIKMVGLLRRCRWRASACRTWKGNFLGLWHESKHNLEEGGRCSSKCCCRPTNPTWTCCKYFSSKNFF